jgi:hypothetical protein
MAVSHPEWDLLTNPDGPVHVQHEDGSLVATPPTVSHRPSNRTEIVEDPADVDLVLSEPGSPDENSGGRDLHRSQRTTLLATLPIPSISSSTVCPGWIQRPSSSPVQPGRVPVQRTSPASSGSPWAA